MCWDRCLLAPMLLLVVSANGPVTPILPANIYQDPRELCEAETFKPLCTDGEVVMVTEAKYGRMQLGRCVRTDYGYVGCHADVLEHLDGMCSGRRSCLLRIPDQSLDLANKCPREFKTYLNVSYECIQVESTACQTCSRQAFAKITSPSAYIGSVVTSETQATSSCGSSKCPWQIEVQSGQTINITLFDFAMEQRTNGGVSPAFVSSESCFRYAVIKESPNHKSIPVCGGKGRSQVIYSSVTNSVEINIVSPEVFSQKGQFVLYYEAIGCPDFRLPDRTELKRYGDIVKVICENPSHSWERKCVGTEWVGEIGTCPGSQGASTSQHPAPTTLPIGVLIAIVLGIALVIGVLIVTVGVVCLKRQRSDYSRPYQPTYYMQGGGRGATDFSTGPCYELREDLQQQQLLGVDPVFVSQLPQPKFCGTLPPPKPPRPGGQQPMRAGSARGGVSGRENVYGAPRMEQRPLPSLPNIPEATAGEQVRQVQAQVSSADQCPCHVGSRPVNARLGPGPSGLRSPTRGAGDQPSLPLAGPGNQLSGHIQLLPCSVGGVVSGPPSQHYTVLDPNEVQQLLQGGVVGGDSAGRMPSCSGSTGCDPLAYGSSFQYLSSDDGTSCGSPTSVAQDSAVVGAPTTGSSCNEIPLRPTRECSQPRIDSASIAGSGSSGNSSWP